jgi:hypothetical protein
LWAVQNLSKPVRSGHWSFFRDCRKIRFVENGPVHRLYQWLSQRASLFRFESVSRDTRRTVRTEVTVERQGLTLAFRDEAADFDFCPFCGHSGRGNSSEAASQGLSPGTVAQLQNDAPKKARS